MIDLERLDRAQNLAVIGTSLLVLAFFAACSCTVMGFDFQPLHHPPEHYAEEAARYRLALVGAVAVCAASAASFGLAIRSAGTERTLATWGVVGVVLVVVMLWFAVSGAVTNIQQADTWATAPPM